MAVQPINTARPPVARPWAAAADHDNDVPPGFGFARDSRDQVYYLWMNTPLGELSSMKLCQLLHDIPGGPAPISTAIAEELRLRGEEDLLRHWRAPH